MGQQDRIQLPATKRLLKKSTKVNLEKKLETLKIISSIY